MQKNISKRNKDRLRTVFLPYSGEVSSVSSGTSANNVHRSSSVGPDFSLPIRYPPNHGRVIISRGSDSVASLKSD
ncbi:hypothetical protein CH371_04410 [Leptospira wolffii]|uniref:Uncharacterized protein n=1 Tax=Leptospira wolffii TaxID=409998 RepID=A0A2M9ZFV3_9LEPT|nr:hypothetical protein CH371_04410 [Leptospira wolffii]